MVCLDTTQWALRDWKKVDEVSDSERVNVARKINGKYRPKTHEIKK